MYKKYTKPEEMLPQSHKPNYEIDLRMISSKSRQATSRPNSEYTRLSVKSSSNNLHQDKRDKMMITNETRFISAKSATKYGKPLLLFFTDA